MTLDDQERLVAESAQTLKPGSTARKWAAVCQGIVAVLLLGVGIVPIAIKYDVDINGNTWSQRYLWIAVVLDNVGSGIWSSVVFLITALVGCNSGKSRSMISLYLVLCLFSVFVSMTVIGVTSGSITVTISLKQDPGYICSADSREVRRSCFGYDDIWYGNSYATPGSGIDCGPYYDCVEQIKRVSNLHFPFYALMLVCGVVEFIAAIFGASWTCVGLCGCCSLQGNQGQPQPQQPMVFHGMTAGGQFVNLGPIPQNGGQPQQPLLVPGPFQTMAPVSAQRVNVA